MPRPLEIKRPSKPEFKDLLALTKASGRRQQARFLLPGYKCLEEALRAKYEIEALLILPETEDAVRKFFGEDAWKQLDWQGKIKQLKLQEMIRLTDQSHPEGLLTVLAMAPDSPPGTEDDAPLPELILDNVSDPGNMGSILRTALWFGFKRIALFGSCADPWSSKTLRAAMGAQLHLASVKKVDLSDVESICKQGGLLLGLNSTGGTSLTQHTFAEKEILVMGSESHGLTLPENLLSEELHIPGDELAESLNVGHAFAICAWCRSHGK
jgi:RNA methyltransferase, TrmH family